MSGVNRVMLLGRLGHTPDMGGKDDNPVCRLSLATSEQWTDKSGERQERTEWHRVVCFGKTAELAGKYLEKGREVHIEGRLQTRKYEKDGVEKYTTEVIADRVTFVGSRGDTNSSHSEDAYG